MESGNEYVIQVKGNQPKLLSAIIKTISENIPVNTDEAKEKNRGRIEHRKVYVYTNIEDPIYSQWYGIKKIIHVVSKGIRSNKAYNEERFYIASKVTQSAKLYNEGIREHWGIENRLHWVKDKIMNEDKSMVLDLKRSENMSIIRNIVINLYRMSGYTSIKYAFETFTNKIESCRNIIYNNFVYD